LWDEGGTAVYGFSDLVLVVFVGSDVEVWKLLWSMKFCIFVLYCCVGKITREFPLSADVMVASFS
jgi:hypothetical protein